MKCRMQECFYTRKNGCIYACAEYVTSPTFFDFIDKCSHAKLKVIDGRSHRMTSLALPKRLPRLTLPASAQDTRFLL